MKQSWLFCGWSCLLLLWSKNISLWFLFVVALCLIWYYIKHYHISWVMFLILFIMILRIGIMFTETSIPQSRVIQVREIHSNYVIGYVDEQEVVVYGLKDVNYQDIVGVEGTYQKFSSLHNFYSFYFPDYLSRRNIHYQINAKKYKLLEEGKGLRHLIFQKVEKISDEKIRQSVKAMFYGIHEDDVSYFLTSSGLHISTLGKILKSLLVIIVSESTASMFMVLFFTFCGHITVFTPSLIRVIVFQIINVYFQSMKSQDRLGLSMVITLLLFPYMAWELAFILPLGFRMIQLFNVAKRHRLLQSFIILIPIQFFYFQACNPIQILLFPVFRYIYACLYVLGIIGFLFSFSFLFTIIDTMIPYMVILEDLGITLYYIPQFLWLMYWGIEGAKFISFSNKKIISLLLLFLYTPFSSYMNPFGEVMMVDVGQGDCTILFMPFHQGAIMIDIMGSKYRNIPKEVVVPILRKKGYSSLDALILTHSDFDHSGGKDELLKEIDVKRIIDSKEKADSIGNLPVAFLLNDIKGSDENENSILTYFVLHDLHFLFMGDAGIEIEQVLTQRYDTLPVDILKVGHHGSDTASSLSFLHAFRPDLALISAGRNNRYHHPSKVVLQRLAQEQVKYLVTAEDGAVLIRICPWFSYYITAEHTAGMLSFHF